jgi:hypothetical protein
LKLIIIPEQRYKIKDCKKCPHSFPADRDGPSWCVKIHKDLEKYYGNGRIHEECPFEDIEENK